MSAERMYAFATCILMVQAGKSDTKDQQQTLSLGPFTLLSTKPIGDGASGDVFLAENRSSKQRVAIKRFKRDSVNDRETLDREIEFLSYVKEQIGAHPNLVRFIQTV